MYCLDCGNECSSEDGKCVCENNKFLSIQTSEIVGGYINLAIDDRLKSHYKKYFKPDSTIRMNNKRIIFTLLIHKYKVKIEKETVDKIYNANIVPSV